MERQTAITADAHESHGFDDAGQEVPTLGFWRKYARQIAHGLVFSTGSTLRLLGMPKIQSLCVFCGASTGSDEVYRQTAARLGTLIGERGIRMVFGGGRIGLMGVTADAALAAGADVVGVIPEHLMKRELEHKHVTELHVVDSMHSRKQLMFDLADAFAVLPGGVGTLDEAFEVITWKQLGMHDKPILLLDVQGYWRPMTDLVGAIVTAGFANATTANLFTTVTTPEALFEALERMPAPRIVADVSRF